LVEAAVTRFRRQREALTIGGWIGCSVGAIGLTASGLKTAAELWWATVAMLGAAIAICVLQFRAVRAARADGPRTASLRQRMMVDFQSWPELVAQFGSMLLPVVTGGLGVLVLTGDHNASRGWLLVIPSIAAVAIAAIAVVLQIRLVRLSQVATEEAELRWEEALRAASVRELASIITWTCWILGASVAFSFEWPSGTPGFVEPLTYGLVVGGLLLMSVGGLIATSSWGLRWPQKRVLE
jgi:hypothetical protein